MDEQGLQKGEDKDKVKNSTFRIPEMHRTDLNKIHEQAKIINEKTSGMGSRCVKSTVMNAGHDMHGIGQTLSLQQYGNLGGVMSKEEFTAALMSQA